MNWIIDFGEAGSLPQPGDGSSLEIDSDLHVDEMMNPEAYNVSRNFTASELDGGESGQMADLRRNIVQDMWRQYESYLQDLGPS